MFRWYFGVSKLLKKGHKGQELAWCMSSTLSHLTSFCHSRGQQLSEVSTVIKLYTVNSSPLIVRYLNLFESHLRVQINGLKWPTQVSATFLGARYSWWVDAYPSAPGGRTNPCLPWALYKPREKIRVGRSCPPSCILYPGSPQLIRQMLSLCGHDERRRFEVNGVQCHCNEAGTAARRKMEYISSAPNFFLLRFLTALIRVLPKCPFSCLQEVLAFPLLCSPWFFCVCRPKKWAGFYFPSLSFMSPSLNFREGTLVPWPKGCVLCLTWRASAAQSCGAKVLNPGGPTFGFVGCPFFRGTPFYS